MKQKRKTDKQKVGNAGENIACMFLMKHGFTILERNHLRRWGEIDIIAKKRGVIHFVEVKTVSYETSFRPEENIHLWKVRRLKRTIQTYLMENATKGSENPPWQFDMMAVFLNIETRTARCRFSENVIL